MANMDLVISSCTSLPHLAGALARPVWLAAKYVPEWRWGIEGEDNPWYPTMRVFRQPRRTTGSRCSRAWRRALTRLLTLKPAVHRGLRAPEPTLPATYTEGGIPMQIRNQLLALAIALAFAGSALAQAPAPNTGSALTEADVRA
jgi:hypothetical protein